MIRETCARLAKNFDEEHSDVLRAARILGQVLLNKGATTEQEGAELLRSTHATQVRVLGPAHAETQLTASLLRDIPAQDRQPLSKKSARDEA